MPLTENDVLNAGASAKSCKLFDGGGLFLLVTPKGKKWWRLKYRFARKENQLSLGVYPDVSLADARELRAKYRKLLADGIDPSDMRKAEKAGKLAEELRRIAATRFMLDNDGALSFRLGNRCLALNESETTELRAFLDATRGVTIRSKSCR
ncbi:MAG: DUF4102 domain-containing protein [Burkholderiales bacterium]|nr:DUF4102 domain-containing protein [Burkholderiales bacterium]